MYARMRRDRHGVKSKEKSLGGGGKVIMNKCKKGRRTGKEERNEEGKVRKRERERGR